MTRWRCVLALWLLLASCVSAAAPLVRVVGPEAVVADVVTRLARLRPAVDLRNESGPIAQAGSAAANPDDMPRLVIAVGAKAFLDAVEQQRSVKGGPPVIGVALTRQTYRQAPAGRHTALYWEPDPRRQLQLARVLLPGALRAGVLLSAPDDALITSLRSEASRLGLELVVGVTGPDDSLSKRLNAVLADSDFLLGIDDPGVFSPASAKTVLLTSYRHGKPVIGPTASWVSAGSVASLTSGIPALVDALSAMLPALLAGGELPAPRYQDFESISTNASVARSLQLSLPPLPRIEARVRGDGEKP